MEFYFETLGIGCLCIALRQRALAIAERVTGAQQDGIAVKKLEEKETQ